jgi:hypothetical protein
MNNVLETVISQYANSPTIVGMIERFNDAIKTEVDIEKIYNFVWNVLEEFPLFPPDPSEQLNYFGFSESPDSYPFDQEPFYGLVILVDSDSKYFGFSESLEAFPFDEQPFYFGLDPDTGIGGYFGYDIWGRIVGVSRRVTIPDIAGYFGFSESPDSYPFGDQPFYYGVNTLYYLLDDENYRKLILAKAISNIEAATSGNINYSLRTFFGERGTCYVNEVETINDNSNYFGFSESPEAFPFGQESFFSGYGYNILGKNNMKMRYTFEFLLNTIDIAIIKQTSAFQKPTGVLAFIFQTEVPVFGFSEGGIKMAPFGQSPFLERENYATI